MKSDSLVESLSVLLQSRGIWHALKLPIWLSKGRAYFKGQVAKLVDLDASTLPYNSEVITFLRDCKADGSRLILATAANQKVAHAVAYHLQLFDEVLASDEVVNLKGTRKLEAFKARLLATSQLDELGFKATVSFEEGVNRTVAAYAKRFA